MISMEEAMRDVIRRLKHVAEAHQSKALAHDRDIAATMIRRDMERRHSAEIEAMVYDIERDLEKELAMEEERREADAVAAKEFAVKAAAAEEAERQRLEEAP